MGFQSARQAASAYPGMVLLAQRGSRFGDAIQVVIDGSCREGHLQRGEQDVHADVPWLYVGMYTLFATLQVTLPARSIYDDLDGVAEPGTPLGEQHHAWVRRRGLPCGLEAHDHP